MRSCDQCDEVSEAVLVERIATVKSAMRKRPAAFPDLIVTSAHTGVGMENTCAAAVARLLAERAVPPQGVDHE